MFELHFPKIHRSSVRRVVKELEDVNHEPHLVWTTVGNFLSIEDQDKIYEGEPKPYVLLFWW
jgi:hypothetical protein